MNPQRAEYDELQGHTRAAVSADERAFSPAPASPSPNAHTPPPPLHQAPANEALAFGCLVVGRDVNIAGTLSVPGGVQVEGRIDGKVEATEIFVLPGGMLVGEVSCAHAIISGTFKGQLHCTEQLSIMRNAQVEGELHYFKDICVEAGATLNCTVRFREDPAPIHSITPNLDKIAPLVRSTTTFLAANERALVRDVVSMPSSLMTRLFGSSKTN